MKNATRKFFSMSIPGLGILVLVVIVPLVAYSLLTYSEKQFTYCKTYQDLERSGLLEKGWVTNNFPSSASEIYELHDIDSNVVWVKFRADRVEIDRFAGEMTPFRIEDYNGVDLLIPGKGFPFKRYKRMDRNSLTKVFRNVRKDDFNDYYDKETVEYLAELAGDKDGASYYYWTDGGRLVSKN